MGSGRAVVANIRAYDSLHRRRLRDSAHIRRWPESRDHAGFARSAGSPQARTTFFVMGRSVRAFPSLAKDIADRGHTIGNHTDTHPALTFLSPRRNSSELDRCDDAIAAAIGRRTRWMRPPFGFRGPQLNSLIQQRQGMRVVMWSAMAWDWKATDSGSVINHLRRVKGGDIVLLHDGDHRVLDGDRRHTVAALEHWLPRWKDAGIRFTSLDDLYPGA